MRTADIPDEITEFLLARIAEDEAIGRDWRHHPRKVEVYGGGTGYLRLANPDRVLVECEAKRRIVERHLDNRMVPDAEFETGIVIRALASVYADHPDFREEWRLTS